MRWEVKKLFMVIVGGFLIKSIFLNYVGLLAIKATATTNIFCNVGLYNYFRFMLIYNSYIPIFLAKKYVRTTFLPSSFWTARSKISIVFIYVLAYINPLSAEKKCINHGDERGFFNLKSTATHKIKVGENYSCLFNSRPNICKSWCSSKQLFCLDQK